MNHREMDALVAEEIIGWVRIENLAPNNGNSWFGLPPYPGEHGLKLPYYTTFAGDDYEVLCHVRDHDDWRSGIPPVRYYKFLDALQDIWYKRAGDFGLSGMDYAALYEPGDYSRAALAALGIKEEVAK